MDKEQATNHILTRLRDGLESKEIAGELSHILKAPPAIIERFVDQVISNHPQVVTPSQVNADLPDWMESLSIQAEKPQTEPSPSFTDIDLPPGLRALLSESSTNVDIFPADLVGSASTHPSVNSPEMVQPQQAEFEAPVERTIDPESQDEASKIDLEALSEFTFQQLKKQRRHNDIVEAVCRKTGWHWNQSQRFVARVQTKHHDELQAGKNRVILVVGIGIILAGLVITFNGVSALSDYASMAASINTNPEVLLDVSLQGLIYSLAATIMGIGMIIGSGFGIARALSSR